VIDKPNLFEAARAIRNPQLVGCEFRREGNNHTIYGPQDLSGPTPPRGERLPGLQDLHRSSNSETFSETSDYPDVLQTGGRSRCQPDGVAERRLLNRLSPPAEHGKLKAMVLSAHEESLISVVRALPPGEAGKVLGWARQLADLAGERTIEWSDSWTDEDLADATTAALRRFEDQEREGC